MSAVACSTAGGVAHLELNRPERGNALTMDLIAELAACVEQADADPDVLVILLSGRGSGFCGGYDLVEYGETSVPNHDPSEPWDPMVDHTMMSRNVRAFMTLMRATTPVIAQVHGFCVGGGSDLALCADLLLVAEDAKIGYPPARVWGSPTTALWTQRLGPQRAKRLLFTGDCLSGREALEWGLAIEAPPPQQLAERAEALAARIARLPLNQLRMMKLLVNSSLEAQGLANTQLLGTLFDGIARHTPEGYAFARRAADAGFRTAVRERDDPLGDTGRSTFKG